MRLLYSPRNDPQTWNDPQMDPEMIPISLHVDPKMIQLILGMEWCSATELL